MKILVDMNLSPEWADYLIGNSLEAVHWSSCGSPDSPDTAIMTYAKEHNFVVLTNDLDFGTILALTHYEKPSVIQIRSGVLSPIRIGGSVTSAIKKLSTEIEQGALVTIDLNKIRLHLLPL
ncbi:hypothetical protein AGMMS50268_11860 [Spirochaetia bacterium]|nr:hypothetical protein AGMMS50268_11860 [Spirochaetia bacterium]